MPFVDADDAIIKAAGCNIPDIFSAQGEEGFRKIETEVLAGLGANSATVIATGGGCVTRPENYPHLHQNGQIIWIQRDITDLPTEGRPLSQQGKLAEMYRTRKPMYERFSDFAVANSGTPDEVAEAVLALLTGGNRQ